jgi:hypothetical protein
MSGKKTKKRARVLIVDDHPAVRKALADQPAIGCLACDV